MRWLCNAPARRASPLEPVDRLSSSRRKICTSLTLRTRSGNTMSRPIRTVGVWLILLSLGFDRRRWCPEPDSRRRERPPARRPFAKAGTPRRTERHSVLRRQAYQGRAHARHQETRGPRHRHPHARSAAPLSYTASSSTADQAQGQPGHAPVTVRATAISPQRTANWRSTLDKAYGPGDTIDLAIEYAGSPDHGLHFVLPDARLSRKADSRSGRRASPRTPTTGSPATTIPTTVRPAR